MVRAGIVRQMQRVDDAVVARDLVEPAGLAREDGVQRRQDVAVARIIGKYIRHQHAAGPKQPAAIRIEGGVCQARRQPGRVEAVDEQHVRRAWMRGQPVGRVGVDDGEARAVGRHVEGVAQGDYVGPQFDDRDVRVGKMAVAELGQRSAAKPDHDDPPRPRDEQHEAHHGAQICEHEGVGARQQHLALYVAGQEFQRAPAAPGAHERWGVLMERHGFEYKARAQRHDLLQAIGF